MSERQITNQFGAFGAEQDYGKRDEEEYEIAGANAVLAGQVVALATAEANAGKVLRATAVNQAGLIGIALEAGAVGDRILVCTRGFCPGLVGAPLTEGAAVGTETDGDVGPAATAGDTVVGICVVDGTTGNLNSLIYVNPQGVV